MKQIFLTSLLIALSMFGFAQTKKTGAIKKNSTSSTLQNKSESKAELFNKLRSKILVYGDNIADVTFSTENNELTVLYEKVHKNLKLVQFVDQLDIDGMSWEIQEDNAIKFRITSSSQEYYASKIRMGALDFFIDNQRELLRIMPQWKELSQDSINKLTGVFIIKQLMDSSPEEYNLNNLTYDEKALEVYLFTGRTAILFSLGKISSEPNFPENIAALYKKLIMKCKSEKKVANE